jgi:polar amino acid transport system substrate-binding protein
MRMTTATIGLTLGLLTLAACANPETESQAAPAGGETSSESREELEAVPELADAVPAEIAERGTLQFGITSTNMPAQFTDADGNSVGVVVELYEMAAQLLGLEADFDTVTFDALQPGLESGRYDIVTQGINKERAELFDIISLYSNGFSTIAHASSDLTDVDFRTQLCGQSVAVTRGTLIETLVSSEIQDACAAAGEPPIEISAYGDNSGVVLAVTSQQNEVGILETVVANGYSVQNDDMKVVGEEPFSSSGAAISPDQPELTDAFRNALLHLVDEGIYQEVLEKYGIGEQAIPELTVE